MACTRQLPVRKFHWQMQSAPLCLWLLGCVLSQPSLGQSSTDEAPTFQLNELRVLGNTVLPPIKIQSLLMPYLGSQHSLQDVELARLALENEYHAAGYGSVYVDIPEQTIGADGVVRLHVTEARLKPTAIIGTRYFSNRQIRAAVPFAEAGVVPNLPELQAQIAEVNAVTADRQVVPVLKAGSEPGTVQLALQVKDRLPLHAVAELNNQYTADTTELRASLALSYDNAFARQDSLSLQYQTSPQDTSEVKVFAAAYVARLSDPHNKLSLSYIDSSSRVATLGDIVVAGAGKNYNLDFMRSLQASSEMISSATVGVHYKDSIQDVNLPGDSNNGQLDTPLHYTSMQAAYSLLLFTPQRLWSLVSSLTIGLPGLGSSSEEFANKCYACKANFSVMHLDVGVRQKLPWNLSLAMQTGAQYSADPLVSNEQFLLGGARNVRGYLEADELGDVGVRGSIELHVAQLIPAFWGLTLEPYVFYDAGRASFQAPLPGQPRSSSLQSTGVGLDLQGWQHFTGALMVAKPLIASSHTDKSDTRLQFWIRGSW